MLDLQLLKKILDSFGFPVVVALWLMLRTDKRLDKLLELQIEMINACKEKKLP